MSHHLKDQTDEQLQAALVSLMGERNVIRQRMKEINDEQTRRQAVAAARAKLDAMSDPEKRALAQEIKGAGGIESLEKVGVPS